MEQGFSRRFGICAVGDLHRVRFFKVHYGVGVGSFESARFLPAGLIRGSGDAVHGLCAVGDPPSIAIMFVLLFLCGWFLWDGMAAMRTHHGSLVVTEKSVGGIVSVWNCAHNVGGGLPPLLFLLGMARFNDWHAALYMPAFGAILVAIIAFALMRKTPQSCGLPPIEEYKTTTRMISERASEKHEEELTAKQIFMKYVPPNKLLWYIAVANVFVHLLRYGIPDWSPDLPERGEALRAG